MKNNSVMLEALVQGLALEKGSSSTDVVEWDLQHGRLEVREYWWVKADEEMRGYLEEEFGGPEVRWYGRVRRRRRPFHQEKWSSEEVIIIYGGDGGPEATLSNSAGGCEVIGGLRTGCLGYWM